MVRLVLELLANGSVVVALTAVLLWWTVRLPIAANLPGVVSQLRLRLDLARVDVLLTLVQPLEVVEVAVLRGL